MDEKGRIIEQVRLNNKPDDLIGFVDRLPAQSKIALEATGNWYYFYIRSIALSTEKTQLLGRYHTESLNYAVVW
jgi:hypothetical protein